jgi:sigma-54 dependent transcriptional regulator, acetoin dehydrogenase operon transcriptional activator AcoR
VRVDVPPLRDRLEDLPTIVHALIERSGARGRMLPAAIRALSQQEWEGNIGELATVVTAALEGRRTADLTVRDLPPEYQSHPPRRLTRMEQVERSAIVRALTDAGGNRTRAAELAGIGRATLYRKIRAYGLDTEATLI